MLLFPCFRLCYMLYLTFLIYDLIFIALFFTQQISHNWKSHDFNVNLQSFLFLYLHLLQEDFALLGSTG
jgi:hypothetical protein